MIRRLLLALLLLGSSLRADAGFYTDIWYNVLQSGQGYNLVQTDGFIFITFFIYAEDGTPTWVIATLDYDEGTASFTGDLIATTGTFFGAPWVGATEVTVGTATFTPSASNAYEGTLAYSYTGRGSANVAITRQTLTGVAIAGRYTGNSRGTYAACANPADDGSYNTEARIRVTQEGGNATLVFGFDSGLRCTITGALIQNGQLYRIAGASYTCNDGLSTTADVTELRRTAHALEGRLVAANVFGGCTERARFAALASSQ